MSTRRLFFALWLDQQAARAAHRAAQDIAQKFGGRVMRPETLHLTLAFLGQVDEARLPTLQSLGKDAAAATAPFVLSFDQLAHWRHNHIVQASCREIPAALPELVAHLRRELAGLGLTVDPRPFFPHLTLLRKVLTAMPEAPLTPPISLAGNPLQLVESMPQTVGADRYQALAQWPLAGSD